MKLINILLLSCFFLCPSSFVFGQGPLSPTAAPAPTMVTLSQIEPRTPISSAPYRITASGSYYLTTNLGLANFATGIVVSASNVSIDLNGFTIVGTSGEGGPAITVPFPGFQNITVRNGSINSCFIGIDATNAAACLIDNVSCFLIYNNAVSVGPGSVVRNCAIRTAAAAGEGYGVLAGAGSVVDHCALFNDTGLRNGDAIGVGGNCLVDSCAVSNFFEGIVTGNNCAIKACSASFNVNYGIQAGSGCAINGCAALGNIEGIACGNQGLIADCTATANTVTGIVGGVVCKVMNCVVGSNGIGISLGDHGQVTGCHVNANNFGIQVTNFSLVKDNMVDFNTTAGIYVSGSANRIEANNITRGSTGLDVTSSSNLIIRNSVSGATSDNYNVAANNKLSVIAAPNSTAVLGNSGGSGVGTTDPWANLSY